MNPLVSICCITFNHKPYIAQCLEGLVNQNVHFDFEIIVNDDCSTDGTAEIIKDYASRYPGRFIPILHDQNQYSRGIKRILQTFVFPRARGKYIALCEGDDYWTDPNKLQLEVDYLENHPECGMVYTQAQVLYQSTGKIVLNESRQQDFVDILTNEDRIVTLTTCFRKELMLGYMKNIHADRNWMMGDLPWWLYISYHSEIKLLPVVTGVYRFLDESASHSANVERKVRFSKSAYSVRCFFAKLFGQEKYLKDIGIFELNDLFKISVFYNKNLTLTIFKFAKENSLLNMKVIFKLMLYSMSCGRWFHKRKYGKAVL